MAALRNLPPTLGADDKAMIARQIRAGYVFLSGILYEPPAEFRDLPEGFLPAHRPLEAEAAGAGERIPGIAGRMPARRRQFRDVAPQFRRRRKRGWTWGNPIRGMFP